jgi:hypothetical protein
MNTEMARGVQMSADLEAEILGIWASPSQKWLRPPAAATCSPQAAQ